jgi:flagellar export protein FliJ
LSAPRSAADRGLRAVARVRGVREQDSREGLQLAVADQRSREERLRELSRRLAEAPAHLEGSPADVLGLRLALGFLGDEIREARTEVEHGEIVVDAARARWEHDKSQLSAVEKLLARRAARRRAEAARAEAKENDDIAAQRWSRTRGDAS